MPVTGDFDTHESAVKLGELLADLTPGLTAAEIHAVIAARLEQSDDDPRLASLVADGHDFAAKWTALAQGQPLPGPAWETVVLPAVVAFSSQQTLKAHLERATSLWMSTHPDEGEALPAVDAEGQAMAAHDVRLGIPDGHSGQHPVLTLFPTDDLTAPAATQRWPRSLVALALVALAVAGGFWWLDHGLTSAGQPQVMSPAGVGQPQPQSTGPRTTRAPVMPSAPGAGPAEPTAPSTLAAPTPTWAGTGPVVAPTAPLGLTVRGTTSTTVHLSWLPPVDPGSGGVSHYRILRDGADAGWTVNNRVAVNQLTPGASYTFGIVAYNSAGLASPSSETVNATTMSVVSPTATPPPVAVLSISPRPAIKLGDPFAVTGTGWPCFAPSTVRVLLGGRAVALATLDDLGAFAVAIEVNATNPAAPEVRALDGGDPIVLVKGVLPVVAELATQPSCAINLRQSTQINFR
ncbi:hypothetical protein Rhe02_90420 [Rhizocola hellebori]|uniref:Fibronectin type-III domain-containing protein n=1 Tax=Rhizocola hellebori TaxID=1392758 RepID=A0A8J3VLL8_9ACTN|nr:hypothetical protein Rhe02_90420 [Rhizocola hellebori]